LVFSALPTWAIPALFTKMSIFFMLLIVKFHKVVD
jgi:hypothetical protein